MQATATLDEPPRPQCKVIKHNNQRCKNRALDADWCYSHHPDPASVRSSSLDDLAAEPEPPADPLQALELHLARLRDERDEAERAAGEALARANRLAVEMIATARRRNLLAQEQTRLAVTP
jgi:hypothetical protein